MMLLFVTSLALAFALAGVCFLLGRMLVALFRIELLRRPTEANWLASAFLGAALLTLVFGWGSHAGYPARICLFGVGALIGLLSLAISWQRRWRETFRWPGASAILWALLALVALRITLELLPLALGGGFLFYSDSLNYFAVSEWLQHDGFGGPVAELATVDSPARMVYDFQVMHHRMGPMFLLALMKAAVPSCPTAILYLVVQAWGVVLNVAGIYLLCRWVLGLSRGMSLAGAFLAAVSMSTLMTSASHNFFCQIYGTATMALGLAIFSRLLAPVHWTLGNAALVGLVLAMQVSVYGELAPILGLAAIVCAGINFTRPHVRANLGLFIRFLFGVVVFVVLFANIELVRVVQAVIYMAGLSGVGWHIHWGVADYLRFTLGFLTTPVNYFTSERHLRPWVVTGLVAVLFLVGLIVTGKRRRALPVTMAFVVLLALACYFRLVALDPWTHERGHTWNLFKLSKWAFPVVMAFQTAGLAWLLQKTRWPCVALAGVCFAVAVFAYPRQEIKARQAFQDQAVQTGPNSTVGDFEKLKESFDAVGHNPLYLLTTPDAAHPRRVFLYSAFLSNTTKPIGKRTVLDGPIASLEEDARFFYYRPDPTGDSVDQLPFGLALFDHTKPGVFRLDNANDRGLREFAQPTWLGNIPVRVWIFSPEPRDVTLAMDLQAGPSLPEQTRRTLRVISPDGTAHDETLDLRDQTTWRMAVTLPRGVSCVTLHCVDRSTFSIPKDSRVQLVRMSGLCVGE